MKKIVIIVCLYIGILLPVYPISAEQITDIDKFDANAISNNTYETIKLLEEEMSKNNTDVISELEKMELDYKEDLKK